MQRNGITIAFMWIWIDPREGSECHRGLCLSEALVNLNTSKLLEGFCHGWVHLQIVRI